MRRYTSARQLYEFPLAVIVGLSADEQLAATRRSLHTYLWRAAAGSLVLILIAIVLGRLSRQLALSRQRAVEEQIAHAARVEYLAYHDGLTALPNRSLFSKLLGQSISQAHRYDRQLAVLFLDLDRFKQINDTLGHEAGDQLLQEVATRLKACLRDSDTVARLGGDEFVVLLPELDVEKYAATVAQKILSAVARPFVLLGQEFRVTASIGISTYPQDGLDEQTLTKNADIAMYQAKEEGKNNFQFYSEKLNANSLERLTLESGLRHALERNEFQLHYQAKRDIRSGRITGMEALLRWQHPDLGTVAPMQFIPVAEETGLIVPIGKWVLKTACLQNVAWQSEGLPHLSMAVNLTARQFSDEGLLPDLTSDPRGHRHGCPPSGARDHRKPADARCRKDPADLDRTQGHGDPDRHRRLRHRLFLAFSAQAIPPRYHQDRSFVHPRRHERGGGQGPDRGHHRDGPDPEPDRRGAGVGNEGAGRLPAPERLRRVPGLLSRPTHARAPDRGVAADRAAVADRCHAR